MRSAFSTAGTLLMAISIAGAIPDISVSGKLGEDRVEYSSSNESEAAILKKPYKTPKAIAYLALISVWIPILGASLLFVCIF